MGGSGAEVFIREVRVTQKERQIDFKAGLNIQQEEGCCCSIM